MVEIVDESFTSRFIKIKEQRERKKYKKVFQIPTKWGNVIFLHIYNDGMVN